MQPGTARGANDACRPTGNGGCAGITVTMPKVEERVADLVVERLDSPDFAAALERARQAADRADLSFSAAVDQLNRDRAALASLDDAYADGLLDQPRYRRQVARITARISEREAKVAAMVTTGPALGFDGQGALIRRAWEAMALEERRTVVGRRRRAFHHRARSAAAEPLAAGTCQARLEVLGTSMASRPPVSFSTNL